MICYVLAMGKQHLGPHVIVGYGIKIFSPGLFITSPDHLECLVNLYIFVEGNTTAKLNFTTIATTLVIWARLSKSAIIANRGLNCLTDD